MALPQHKTTLSILRSIIGAGAGGEVRFSQKIGRSTSWVKKASCGQIKLTRDAAIAINYATGVSSKWLLDGDVNRPPVAGDGSPFTKETYAQYHQKDGSEHDWEDGNYAEYEFTSCARVLVESLHAAISKNRGGLFCLYLCDFVDQMTKRFGRTETSPQKFRKYMARDIYQELCREPSPLKTSGNLEAGLEALSSEKETKSSPKKKQAKIKTSTPQKKQPSRKPKRASRR